MKIISNIIVFMSQNPVINNAELDNISAREYIRRVSRAHLEKKGVKPRAKISEDKYDEVCRKFYIDNISMKALSTEYHVGYPKLKEILAAGKDKYTPVQLPSYHEALPAEAAASASQ